MNASITYTRVEEDNLKISKTYNAKKPEGNCMK